LGALAPRAGSLDPGRALQVDGQAGVNTLEIDAEGRSVSLTPTSVTLGDDPQGSSTALFGSVGRNRSIQLSFECLVAA